MRILYRFFLITIGGWRIIDNRPVDLTSYLAVVAPHTSNWDFFLGLAVRSLARMRDVKYLAKASLFKPPFGWFFRSVGGYPVDRTKHNNLVDSVVAMYKSGEISKIALTPEGTRKYQPNWKSGFHHIARGAGVPLILIAFDYGRKQVVLSEPFPLTDSAEADIVRIKDWFRPHKGRNPEDGIR